MQGKILAKLSGRISHDKFFNCYQYEKNSQYKKYTNFVLKT